MNSFGILAFGELASDLPAFGPQHVQIASNCLPRRWGYAPLRQIQEFTDALPDRAVGATSLSDADGNAFNLVGTTSTIQQGADTAWLDVSNVSGYNPTGRWEFAAWENRALAASLENSLQSLTLGNPNFVDLDPTINAATIAVVRNQIMVGHVDDADGLTPNRLRWSALNDPDDWTPSQSTLAGFVQLESTSGGAILRVIGGEFAIVFLDRSIWRATFTGDPVSAYQLDEVEQGIGVLGAGSIVRYDGGAWYLSEDGFRVTRGGKSESLGEERIDTTVLQDLDQNFADRITATYLPDEQTVIWAYPGAGNVGGTPNRLVLYNAGANRWATGDESVDQLLQVRRAFTSLEALDALYATLEEIPGSLDDAIWTGGSLAPGAITANGKAGLFSGPPRTAVLETQEVQHNPGRKSYVGEVRPVIDADDVDVEIGHRDNQSGGIVYTVPRQPNAAGVVETRVNARYVRYRATVRPPWVSAVGVEPFGVPTGDR